MSDMIVLEGEITEDGQLVVQLPPDAPRGHVQVVVKKVQEAPKRPLSPEEQAAYDAVYDPELEALLTDEPLSGMGLTAGEMADAPVFGIWADRTDITDSAEYVENMRRESNERRKRMWRD